jgi:hypothetical protein
MPGGAAEHGHLGRQGRHHDGRGGGGGPHNSLPGTALHHLSTEDNPDAEPLEAALLRCRAEPKTLPGTAPGQAMIGSKVKLTFEATPASGQKVPEGQVIY